MSERCSRSRHSSGTSDVRFAARRHEVEDTRNAVVGLPGRLQHHRVVEIAACRLALADWCEQPAAVLWRTEKRSKARTRIEAREAEPVDRAATLDQRRCLQ